MGYTVKYIVKKNIHKQKKLVKVLYVLIVFILCAVFIIIGTLRINARNASLRSLDSNAEAIGYNIIKSIENYSDVLYGSRSYYLASDEVTQDEWKTYFKEQDIFTRYPGMSAIAFSEFFLNSEKDAFLTKMRSHPDFGEAFNITPEGERDNYIVPSLITSLYDVTAANGIDFSTREPQKSSFKLAAQLNQPIATPPYTFSTNEYGFLGLLPVYSGDEMLGYIGISFRVSPFIEANFTNVPKDIAFSIKDVTNNSEMLTLHETPNFTETNGIERSDTINFLNRDWQITYKVSETFGQSFWTKHIGKAVLAFGLSTIFVMSYSIKLVKTFN